MARRVKLLHFPERDDAWAENIAARADFPLYMIDDDTAIRVDGDKQLVENMAADTASGSGDQSGHEVFPLARSAQARKSACPGSGPRDR